MSKTSVLKLIGRIESILNETHKNFNKGKNSLICNNILASLSSSTVSLMEIEADLYNDSDLQVGNVYNSKNIADFFGINMQQGIGESKKRNCIVLLSSYRMQGKFNDSYDQAAGIYSFNGIGSKTNLNSRFYTKVLDTAENGKTIHLFVATKDIPLRQAEDQDLKLEYSARSYYIYCGELVLVSSKEDIEMDLNSNLPILKFKPQDKASFDRAYNNAKVFYENRLKNEEERKKKLKEQKERDAMFKKMNADFEKQVKEENENYGYTRRRRR